MLLVTGADHYIGYAIASHLAQYKELRPNLRVLCQSKSRCHGFANANIDVRTIDYQHPNQLSVAFRGVEYLILAIGNEDNRVSNAKSICNVAAHSGVKNIICISHVGAVSKAHASLQDYDQIEQYVMESGCSYTILRLDFVQQYFHLWSNYAEKHRQILLPLTEEAEICPIAISDVCKAIENLLLEENTHTCKPLDDMHDGQVYILTGPEKIHGKRMVELLTSSTGYEHFKYRRGRPMDLDYYLSGLSKDIWFDARLKQEMSHMYHDTFDRKEYQSRVHGFPTAKQIQTYLDYFDWVQQTSGSICVPHASMLTKSPCESIQHFFEQNANSFKPRV
ncbi:NAD(P)H azoreductase [Choanephora cucurbitarum]|uniref:NAD(P)H azoreductase n=1 Tax=Choanephora cucurbitarum TaxID=101091 RepID=A0A1C7N7C8_9FUNG|nr:NAD(P)H azoreductase [Choanephora cucurbitarum]